MVLNFVNPLDPLPQVRELTPAMNRAILADTIILRTLLQEMAQDRVLTDKYRDYYEGEQILVYGTEKFRELFPSFKGLMDNWCSVVIDALTEKMKLLGIKLDEEGENDDRANQIWNVFRDNNIDEQEKELTETVFVEGRAAVIVWPDEDLGARIDWNPPSVVRVRYSEDDYRKVDFAVKRWETPSGEIRVNVYDKNEVRKYIEGKDPSLAESRDPGVRGTVPRREPSFSIQPRLVEGEEWPLSHPFGVVPVVEFPNKRGSELKDVIPLQDGINYLLVSAFVAGEFSALKQKVFFTHLKEPTGGWQNLPGRVWHLGPMLDSDGKPLHGQMGEFQASELGQYRSLIEMVLQHLALTSKTPVRMFFKSDRGGRGDAPSGESELIEDEPLLDKAQDRETRLGNRWIEVARLVAKAIEIDGDIRGEMIWEDPRSKYRSSILDEAIKYANVKDGLGLPIEWVIKHLGLPPEDLEELEALLAVQLEEQKEFQAALNQAQLDKISGAGSGGGGESETSPPSGPASDPSTN